MYLRPAACITGNTVNMLNILRCLCKNVHRCYSYYRPMGVTASSVGAAHVVSTSAVNCLERFVSKIAINVPSGTLYFAQAFVMHR